MSKVLDLLELFEEQNLDPFYMDEKEYEELLLEEEESEE